MLKCVYDIESWSVLFGQSYPLDLPFFVTHSSFFWQTNYYVMGSGCDSVGRAVASNSRGPRFESSQWQHFILNIYCQLYWKDENKEKRPWMATFLKNLLLCATGISFANGPPCYWWWPVSFTVVGSNLNMLNCAPGTNGMSQVGYYEFYQLVGQMTS